MGTNFAPHRIMEGQPLHAGEKLTAGTHIPYWINTVAPMAFSRLELDKTVDVVIVGGGIAGVSIAYCLSCAGKKVALVEDGFIGSGETGRTTAHLVSALDDRYYEMERLFGAEALGRIAMSHQSAIDFIERTSIKENIDCDFERLDGFLFLHPSDKPANLDKEMEALRKTPLQTELTEIQLKDKSHRAIRFANQAQFHPLKYVKGLCDAILRHGGDIYTSTHAKEISSEGIVTDEGYRIKAEHVVIATNSPVNNKYALHLKQYPYRTYVIGLKVQRDLLPRALWWDTGDFETNAEIPPYHYVRTHRYNSSHDLLIVGGEDHATGLADAQLKPEAERYGLLEAWAREHFDGLEDVVYRWSGQVMEPMDALAYIGKNPFDANNVYIATGDSGNGMTHGTIAGLLIRDLILNRENEWEKHYSPSRLKLIKAGKTFFKEFVAGFISYLKTKPKGHESHIQDIQPNEGRIIEFEGKKFGAYRDEAQQLHFVGAECTHLGCMVKWNNDEKSWDCPCHGSRFTYEGHVLNGPANQALPYYSQAQAFTVEHQKKK